MVSCELSAQQLNGFDLSGALIPSEQILSGGPPRDGIPSIDNPEFLPTDEYRVFADNVEVLGVFYNNVAKAYPITIMDWHEVVNDHFDGLPVVVTYCPLCGSGIAFQAMVNGQPSQFGVSGLLYNSDVLLYDRNTNSLWSQIMAESVSGTQKGNRLEIVSTQRMKLGTWRALHPETLVLTTETGFNRDYTRGPYGDYIQHNRTYFPLTNEDNTFHKKEWVLGVEINGVHKAYPIEQLVKLKDNRLRDKLAGTAFTISWGKHGENLVVAAENGEKVIALQMFWFAWAAFHPKTLVMTEGLRD